MSRPVNFYPGPAIIPLPVLEEASRAVVALDGVGLSVMEISHRSKEFEAIAFAARDCLRRLLKVPETHEILFLQGGARGQFAQVPLNFLREGQRAGFVMTGAWSDYAIKEAATLGGTVEIASSKASGYTRLPELPETLPGDLAYVHTTSNNTIFGTQWREMPDFGDVRHVSDMSSDILSRPIDVSRYALIYAGAQKNCGPSGITIVIIDRAWMASAKTRIPAIWRYETQAKKDSMFNTPPTFPIYCVGLVARWLEELGGIEAIAERNAGKAKLLYEAIDGSDGFYRGCVANPAHRSTMNVTWRMPSEALEKRFVAAATESQLIGLKGHRSAGGLRASLYNAMPVAGVERLVEFMERFQKTA